MPDSLIEVTGIRTIPQRTPIEKAGGVKKISLEEYDWRCSNADLSTRSMQSMICSYTGMHGPCWCHHGIETFFIGKDGIYEFQSMAGVEESVEVCAEPWTCQPDRFPEESVIYIESSLDGLNWDVLYKKPYDPAKELLPFNFNLPTPKRFRFIRCRMPHTISHTGLCGFLDHAGFTINEVKVEDIPQEGYMANRIYGTARFHEYRNCWSAWGLGRTGIVQVSYDGTTDWENVGTFNIPSLNTEVSFDFSFASRPVRFVRVMSEPARWRGMPITPLVINHSNLTVDVEGGTLSLNCEHDIMESFFPEHPCVSMDTMANYWNWYQSGGFRHTYPLLAPPQGLVIPQGTPFYASIETQNAGGSVVKDFLAAFGTYDPGTGEFTVYWGHVATNVSINSGSDVNDVTCEALSAGTWDVLGAIGTYDAGTGTFTIERAVVAKDALTVT